MHIPLLCLAEAGKPMTKKEINAWQYDPDEINLGRYLDYADDYGKAVRPDEITKIYDGKIFELVQEDKVEGIHHIFRVKEGAERHMAETKLAALKAEFDKLTSENVLRDYWKLQSVVTNPLDYFYVCNARRDYPEAYPFNEWFINYAEEGKTYQIVQAFDAHA